MWELTDTRHLGIVTLGAMKQYTRIETFSFLRSWYLLLFYTGQCPNDTDGDASALSQSGWQ